MQDEEQDYAFQYWFERGCPVKRIHSRLSRLTNEEGVDRTAEEDLLEFMSHNESIGKKVVI